MADSCCGGAGGRASTLNNPRWRKALWIALGINLAMFATEMIAGSAAESRALQADALDFLGDSANYAISLLVAGMALVWRARAALAKGLTLIGLGTWVLVTAVMSALSGSSPEPETMGIVGALALVANVGVALMLYRFRTGDANMRSVWICSRNDAIGNLAVMAAAVGVFGSGAAWPDLIVAALLALLGIAGGVADRPAGMDRVKVCAAGTRNEQGAVACLKPFPSWRSSQSSGRPLFAAKPFAGKAEIGPGRLPTRAENSA